MGAALESEQSKETVQEVGPKEDLSQETLQVASKGWEMGPLYRIGWTLTVKAKALVGGSEGFLELWEDGGEKKSRSRAD